MLVGKVEGLDDHMARAAGIWLLGQFPQVISEEERLLEMLRAFVSPENLFTETDTTQSELLSTLSRLAARGPELFSEATAKEIDGLLKGLLDALINQQQYVDLRERAILLYRLFVRNNDRSLITQFIDQLDQLYTEAGEKHTVGFEPMQPDLLQKLTRELGNLSSVFHLPAKDFTRPKGPSSLNRPTTSTPPEQPPAISDLLDLGLGAITTSASAAPKESSILDLL